MLDSNLILYLAYILGAIVTGGLAIFILRTSFGKFTKFTLIIAILYIAITTLPLEDFLDEICFSVPKGTGWLSWLDLVFTQLSCFL